MLKKSKIFNTSLMYEAYFLFWLESVEVYLEIKNKVLQKYCMSVFSEGFSL